MKPCESGLCAKASEQANVTALQTKSLLTFNVKFKGFWNNVIQWKFPLKTLGNNLSLKDLICHPVPWGVVHLMSRIMVS